MIYEQNDPVACENCKKHLESMQELERLNKKELFILKNPQKTITTNFPVKLDNGETKLVPAYRVQYNNSLGPTKGGIRFHPSVSESEVTELAFLMSLKNSLAGLPYGGSKGGVKIDPRKLSKAEKERVARGYVRAMHQELGEKLDIPAPDVNTDSQVMAWMLDEYEKILGQKAPGTFTGKPLDLGGIEGRSESTARGGFFIIQEDYRNYDKSDLSVAVQGFGNAGKNISKMLYDEGFKVVAISDSSTAIYQEDGLNIDTLIEKESEIIEFEELEEYQKISNKELLELEVELLVPAALGGVITDENASEIKANRILELANSPVTPSAHKTIVENGTNIIPDILANAGGVIVSYFEWVQNLQNYYWSAEEDEKQLKERIQNAYRDVQAESEKHDLDLRTASYTISINRILNSERLKGRL
ncbi:MAG: Glu/Leu/Phe/Val dehydrogenase [Candidatus Pacearchaeota archaeon]